MNPNIKKKMNPNIKKKKNSRLDINKKMVIANFLDKEPKRSKSSKPYEQKKETNIKLKGNGLYPLRTHIDPKLEMDPTNFSESYKVSKTKYENLFPTFYNISKFKKNRFENSVREMNINNLKFNRENENKNDRNRKTLLKFWQDFFKLLSSLFYNVNDKYKDIRINSDGFQSVYQRNFLGDYTIGKNYLDIQGYALGRFNKDFHHNYLTPKITTAKGELHLMPIYDDFNGGHFYKKFLEDNQAPGFKCYNSTKSRNKACYDPSGTHPSYNIGGDGWAKYDNNVNSVIWSPELTHDTYERFLTDNHIEELGDRPWITLRYALNYYADNYATYEHGILIDVNVFSVDNILSVTLDSGIKLEDDTIKSNHANLLIAHICKEKNKNSDKKQIDLYYYENNSDIVFYIKRTLKRLVKLVKKKFDKDKPGFCLDLNITYMAPSEIKSTKVETQAMHGFWATRHGICGEVSRYFGVIWGLLGSYFDNPLKCYLSLQRALFLVKDNKPEHQLVFNLKHGLQRMMTVFNHYDQTGKPNPDIYNYLVMSIAKWERDQKYNKNLRTFENDRPYNVPLKARNDANDFTKPSIIRDANDTSNIVRDPKLFKYHDNLRKFEKDKPKPKDVPLKTRNDANDLTKPSIKIDANNTSNIIRDTRLFPPRGGKKNKKIRKHRGIIQTGGNSGRLKKGYRYSGKRLKNGNAEIIKAKKIKRRQL